MTVEPPTARATPRPRRRIALLGATGSIGTSTLRVVAAHRDQLEVGALAARSDWRKLAALAHEHAVPVVALHDPAAAAQARTSGAFPKGTKILSGDAGLREAAVAPGCDLTVVAVVGTAALHPTLDAIRAGRDIALASKEILVLAGKFVMAEAAARGVRLLPVDSEHNAVFQCIEGHPSAGVRRIILTASGGAFRDWSPERLREAKPADALRHPNWSMGPKVTVDSATLANKGLELIEAQWLFGLKPQQCTAVIHPQSLVHCLVEFVDGAMIGQLAPPSMTFPIQHALLYPSRAPGVEQGIDFTRLVSMDFRPVDEVRFPMLRLAREAMETGGAAPAVFNAANEVAVAAFLDEKIPFLAIPEVVGNTLVNISPVDPSGLDEVLEIDAAARRLATASLTRAALACS